MPYRILLALTLAAALAACGTRSPDAPIPPDDGHGEDSAEPAQGPHRARLLQDGPFAIELAIFETGVPPEFRAWPTLDGRPVPPDQVQLVVELTRLGDEKSRYTFKPDRDLLRAERPVEEPHSFVVEVRAGHAGQTHRWRYENFEGRTTIAAEAAAAAGVQSEVAGPAKLTETVTLYGQLIADPERQREISARFPGVIRSVARQLGDRVRAGETLATIESNESLRTYALTAPLAGVLTRRDANPGEQTGERVLFTVTDPSAVMAELSVFPKDRARVQPGAAVRLRLAEGEATAEGRVQRVEVQAGSNQAVKARVAIAGHDGSFLPGSFVTGEVAVAEREVPLAVKASGLQPFRDSTAVYAQVGETYEVRPLELGPRRGEWVEVLGGLAPGTRYVSRNSYLIKADIEKSGAAHDH